MWGGGTDSGVCCWGLVAGLGSVRLCGKQATGRAACALDVRQQLQAGSRAVSSYQEAAVVAAVSHGPWSNMWYEVHSWMLYETVQAVYTTIAWHNLTVRIAVYGQGGTERDS